MPTSYSVAVTVDGYGTANYGSMLDSLNIISGSTAPYELPQPPSATASFYGLPVVSGVTQTPDWWIGKKVTFTITPQGATGTVTWAGIVQGFNCRPVDRASSVQLVELDLLGQTSRFATEIIQNDTLAIYTTWSTYITTLNNDLSGLTWAEAPSGLTWSAVTTTWATYNNNKSGLSIAGGTLDATVNVDSSIPMAGQDFLSFLTNAWGNKYKGWFWFDDVTMTLNAPASYTNYSQITSLNATTCVLWDSLQSSQNFGDIINSAEVDNKDGSIASTYLDGTSYSQYGYRFRNFGNSIERYESDRKLVATDKVNAFKQPNKYLQSFTVDLDKLTHTTGEWQNYYKSTKPVRLPITNIPAAYGGNHTYMVRGVNLSLTNKHAEATLIVVPSTVYNPA